MTEWKCVRASQELFYSSWETPEHWFTCIKKGEADTKAQSYRSVDCIEAINNYKGELMKSYKLIVAIQKAVNK